MHEHPHKKKNNELTISQRAVIAETDKTLMSNRTMPATSDDDKGVYLVIPLEEILFDDYLIRVRLDKHISLPFSCPESRKSFYLLKRYFKNLHFDELVITAQGNTIKAIENVVHLRECFSYLSIVENYLESSKVETTNAEHIIEKLSTINNETLKKIARKDNVEAYFNYLNENQSSSYKIIPVIEDKSILDRVQEMTKHSDKDKEYIFETLDALIRDFKNKQAYAK